MSELISGKEALIALANGEDVEFKTQRVGQWINIKDIPEYRVTDLLENKFYDEFRLKPRTIMLNIEIEKPKATVLCAITGSVGLFYGDLGKAKAVQEALREVFK